MKEEEETMKCSSARLLLLLLSLAALHSLSYSEQATTPSFYDVNLQSPIVNFSLLSYPDYSCQRVRISGISRLNLESYASAIRITLKVSEFLPERLLGKIQVCFHRNASISLCQCEEGSWEPLQKGQWSSTVSPYENRFIDVKLSEKTSCSFTVSVDEVFQQWRLLCLALGFLLLLVAPIICNWVPFYYSSSMALGILLVVLIILFQGMKLLPGGRKSILYLTLYGSVLGVGSFIAHYFSTVVNSILVSFGLSEEMYNPVYVFLVVGTILAGAALGFWLVRKFILSDDGHVDEGIAQFVKWAIRFIAATSFFQSTLDAPLAFVALAASWIICSLVTMKKWWQQPGKNENSLQLRTRQALTNNRQAEFLSPSSKKGFVRAVWGTSSAPYALSVTPGKGGGSSSYKRATGQNNDYYSTYHKIPVRRFSKKGWGDFTRESTSTALEEWASTPEVAKWIADNAHRMRLDPDSHSDDRSENSDSSEDTGVENDCGRSLFKWH